jgi:uncharacterized protein (TIGR02246 family)
MRNKYMLAFVAGLSLILWGCSDTPPPAADTRAADEKAIRDVEASMLADWKAKDADKILSHYADDANVMVANAPLAKGRDAISGVLKEVVADKNLALNFSPTTVEVAKSGDIGYTQGAYEMTTTNPKSKKPATEKGEYVTVYKKGAGGWKAVQDIVTPSAPAVTVAAAPAARSAKKTARRRR